MVNNELRVPFLRAATEFLDQSHLPDNLSVDYCVVGAGISGMTTAYLLAQQGHSVVILDHERMILRETDRTTAYLSNMMECGYQEIERLHGEEGAWLAAESHTAAMNLMECIVLDEQIACGFERLDGYWLVPPYTGIDTLDLEWDAARRAGVPGVKPVTRLGPPPYLNLTLALVFVFLGRRSSTRDGT